MILLTVILICFGTFSAGTDQMLIPDLKIQFQIFINIYLKKKKKILS